MMKSVLLVLFAIAAVVTAMPPHGRRKTAWHQLGGYTFEKYEAEFGKFYENARERNARKAIFNERLSVIQQHNADDSQTYKRGVNHLSDRTSGELKALHGLDATMLYHAPKPEHTVYTHKDTVNAPKSVDWRKEGVVTPVKNQGECGSCWAFASTETIESQLAIKFGFLEELSEQFILDCTPNPNKCGGTGGCLGGTGELAYAQLKALGGIPSEWTYPYQSGNNGTAYQCHGLPLGPQKPHSGQIRAAVNISGHTCVESNNYDAVLSAVANVGPMAISVDASAWHDYETGVFNGGNHTNPDLDHLVQLVGYGSESFHDYWLVRNSWTPEWGEDGYIKLARYGDKTEHCGTDITPLDGDGCAGGPTSAKVCGQNGLLYDVVYPQISQV